jgi:hypothetical protein
MRGFVKIKILVKVEKLRALPEVQREISDSGLIG